MSARVSTTASSLISSLPAPIATSGLAALSLCAAVAGCTGDSPLLAEDGSPAAAARIGLPLASRAAADQATAPDKPASAASAAALRARPPRPPVDPLLALARGRWLGTCDILLTGRSEPAVTIEIERITEPTGTPGEFTWTLIYRDASGEQVRPYIMRADPAVPGRYLLDENNGIVLTSYLQGPNLLSSDFDVPGVRLHTREEFHRNRYEFEIGVSALAPELVSDLGDDFIINAYRTLNTQKCELRRIHGGGGHHLAQDPAATIEE